MKVQGEPTRSIWYDARRESVAIIDQTLLPHEFRVVQLEFLEQFSEAISSMRVRGAPLIGATAAFGLALALRADASPAAEERASAELVATRPTAVNLRWAVERVRARLRDLPEEDRASTALEEALRIAEEDVETCAAIGRHGLGLLETLAGKKLVGEPLHILTHCNAGWLATVDWGTALAPVYAAHARGIPVHVWVDETRPRNQGASLTAWELGQEGISHSVIVDNAGGHLMQHGQVDLCIVGSDRTTARGDVCNKIGTYLKALAAFDNGVPFYVALPLSTIDWNIQDGLKEIAIEERCADEVREIAGLAADGNRVTVTLTPPGTSASNYAFDVTPARLVTALITERGVVAAEAGAMDRLRPVRPELAS